jgi:hypothetical protein
MRVAFALLALLALTGCGSEDEAAAPPPPVTVTVTDTQTETETVPTEPVVECEAKGVLTTLPEQELPKAVADVRERIVLAARACDYDELEQIALERGEGFTFTYGEGTSPAAYWRELEENGTERPLRALVTILSLPYTRNESGSYAWPSAYDESPAEADWQVLVDTGLYTREQIDSMKEQGSYLGWRTAITADGDWQFFVAGD